MLIKASAKKYLLGLTGASTFVAGTSYYFLYVRVSNDTSKKVDLNEAKTRIKNSNKIDWSKTVSEIKNTPAEKLPEGLRAVKAFEANAEKWAKLFCDEADYDMNESNAEDYLKHCT